MLWGWDGMSRTAAELPLGFDSMSELGTALISPEAFVLPFEAASVLLLAALVGAVYIAFNRR
jgi:NADH-quinone oxidoreductase subunit J